MQRVRASYLGLLAGGLHDIGKVSAEFQSYLAAEGRTGKGPDHSTAGARIAAEDFARLGRMAAYAIAGHHAGLADGVGGRTRTSLEDRLDARRIIPCVDGWQEHALHLPDLVSVETCRLPERIGGYRGFAEMARTRLLFSALVDADSVETEAFVEASVGRGRPVRGGNLTVTHLDAVRRHLEAIAGPVGPLNDLRRTVLDHAVSKSDMDMGLFTMTVPTGGGKTLASLAFATEHARRHGLRRIVYVVPYTAVVEQTARVFETVFGPGVVLEHHSGMDREDDVEGDRESDARMRRSTENWDAPVVVTTAVQFFESLYGSSRSKCRKLHSLTGSVVILDEAQSLPLHLLRPCMAAIDDLASNWHSSVILCTATQPALTKREEALPRKGPGLPRDGLDIPLERELAPDPQGLHVSMRRTRIIQADEPLSIDTIVRRMSSVSSMLCIVNSRADAQELFGAMRYLEGARHLSTSMCAAHRIEVLDGIRRDLAGGRPCRVVSTSLIEAGVDVDFGEVWREGAGLDSIIQAAGRCNREGRADRGDVVVFEFEGRRPSSSMSMAWGAARSVLRRFDDPASPEAVRSYWHGVYRDLGHDGLDAAVLDGRRYPILPAIAAGARHADWPFESVSDAFRIIEERMTSVVVPFGHAGQAAIDAYLAATNPSRRETRALRRYIVQMPDEAVVRLRQEGAISSMGPDGIDILMVDGSAYDADVGLRISART